MKYKHFRSSLLYVCCNFLSNFSFDSFEKVWAVLCDFSLKHTFNPSGSNVIYDLLPWIGLDRSEPYHVLVMLRNQLVAGWGGNLMIRLRRTHQNCQKSSLRS
jgi:hypothetical protein